MITNYAFKQGKKQLERLKIILFKIKKLRKINLNLKDKNKNNQNFKKIKNYLSQFINILSYLKY